MSGNFIFRTSSLDMVSSPEQLNDYIKVSRPGVWLVLAAVIVLIIGGCVWGIFGTITTTRDVVTVVQGGEATCYVSIEDAKNITPGMEVNVGDSTGFIVSVSTESMEVTTDFNNYVQYLGGLKVGERIVPVKVRTTAPDGMYMAQIVLETISPVSFLVN